MSGAVLPVTIKRWIQCAAWWSAALAILLAGAAWIGGGDAGVPAFDRDGLLLANAWRSPWLDAGFRALTWLGSATVLLPLVVAAGITLWRQGHRGDAAFLVMALVGVTALVHLTKPLAFRPRPDLFPALTAVAESFSFPSAHAAQATAVAVASLLVGARLAPRYLCWAAVVLLVLAALVGLSRLYLQVHYPSDVLAGSAAAGCWVLGLRALIPGVRSAQT